MAPQQPSSMEEQSGELCEPESEEGEKQGPGPPSDQAHPATYDAPDGGWGWVVLVATILVLALTLAFPSCIGIFYLDLQEEFQASNSETSWVPSIMTSVLHAGGEDVIEKSVVSTPVAQQNDIAKMTIVLNRFLQHTAYLGAVLLNCCVCGAVMRPARPRKPRKSEVMCNSPRPAGKKGCVLGIFQGLASFLRRHMAFDLFCSNPRFRVFSLGITWMMLGFVVPLIYLVPYATAHKMDPSRAALLLSILGFVNIFVRPPVGVLFSLPWFKGRHIYVFSAALLINGLSNSICCISASFPVLLIFVLTYGLSMSLVGSLMFTVLMDTVEMSRFPSALGLLSIMESVTLLIGPPLAGILVDRTD
ncbi:monocarboxylate transporter 6-like, partial [Sinocyclocheilus grahami]|uniref:monocarboxylate transporter 6-like n=1 Tax=Sinocyclocheilus grahami TaxID=75366 RepID=UPI0007ACF2E5